MQEQITCTMCELYIATNIQDMHATSCLKVKPRIVLWLTSSICLIEQALANKENETFYHYYKYTALSEVGWNLRYVLV